MIFFDFLTELAAFIYANAWYAPAIAFVAGIVTAFTPCSMTCVPLIMTYVGGSNLTKKQSFKLSLIFSFGMVLSSTALGVIVSQLGSMLRYQMYSGWFLVFLGVLLLAMALQVWEVISIIPSTYLTSKTTRRGNIGSFIAGLLGGIFSSPCSTPILVAILVVVAQEGSLTKGIILLLLYSIGHSVLFILAGTYTTQLRVFLQSKKYGLISTVVKYFTGLVILILGLYLIYIGI